jgi:hypothetical protein
VVLTLVVSTQLIQVIHLSHTLCTATPWERTDIDEMYRYAETKLSSWLAWQVALGIYGLGGWWKPHMCESSCLQAGRLVWCDLKLSDIT